MPRLRLRIVIGDLYLEQEGSLFPFTENEIYILKKSPFYNHYWERKIGCFRFRLHQRKRMKINLTQSIHLEDLCKISVVGCPEEIIGEIILSLSPEAILGFATEMIWLYEDVGNRKMRINTNPLGIDPAPNQAMGFYLSSNNPSLMMKVNTLIEDKISSSQVVNSCEISIRNRNTNQYYEVKEPVDEMIGWSCIEPYELSGRNIINIVVLDKGKNDITNQCSTVTIELNRDGLKSLSTMLLVWLHSCKENEYLLPRIGQLELGYNLGVILTGDSIATRFRCCDLGQIYQYDSRM